MSNNYVPGGSGPAAPLNSAESLTYAASIELDLSGPKLKKVTLAGDLSLTARGHTAGVVDVVVKSDASIRTLAFDSDWVFLGTKPTQIAASKTGVLRMYVPSTADADVVCQWAVQS